MKQKAALLRFLDISQWKNPVAITMTMKQGQIINGRLVSLSPDLCSQNLRHFRNVLNRKAFGKASRKRKMKCVAVLEQSADGSYHYHLAMDRPDRFGDFRFQHLTVAVWHETRWGHRQTSYKRAADSDWVDYMCKLRTKASYLDAFDWANCHLN